MKDSFKPTFEQLQNKCPDKTKYTTMIAIKISKRNVNPKILILDEATSNIDSISEQKIQDALKILFKNRTSIVIAHRLSTIKMSDNIFVIKGGKITENGSHKNLMELKADYYEFTISSTNDENKLKKCVEKKSVCFLTKKTIFVHFLMIFSLIFPLF